MLTATLGFVHERWTLNLGSHAYTAALYQMSYLPSTPKYDFPAHLCNKPEAMPSHEIHMQI